MVSNSQNGSHSVTNPYNTKYLNKDVVIHFKNIDKYVVKGKLLSFDSYNNLTVKEDTEYKEKYVIIRGCNIDSIELSN